MLRDGDQTVERNMRRETTNQLGPGWTQKGVGLFGSQGTIASRKGSHGTHQTGKDD